MRSISEPRVSALRLPQAAEQEDAYLEVTPGRLNGRGTRGGMMMDAPNQEFVRAASLEELRAKGRLVVDGHHRPILVVYDRGRVGWGWRALCCALSPVPLPQQARRPLSLSRLACRGI
jgi:hypothetical protein